MWDKTIGRKHAGFYVIGSKDVPLYLYRFGDEWALFEGGITAMGPMVETQLYHTIGGPKNLRYWFITHAHYDHYGLLPYLLPKLDSIQLFISPDGARLINSMRARDLTSRLNAEICTAWQTAITPSRISTLFTELTDTPLPLNLVSNGQDIPLASGAHISVISTPGHSRCSTSFLLEPEGILISSDSLGEIIRPHIFQPLIFDNYRDYTDSLDKLTDISPSMIGMGHHGTLTGRLALSAAKDARKSLEVFSAKIMQCHTSKHEPYALAEDISSDNWGRSSRFITRELHYKSMLRMIELITNAKESSDG